MTEQERMDVSKKELEKRAIRDFKLKGRPGKGHKGNYKFFCRRCHVEYWIEDITKCTHCSGELLTEEERMTELRGRLGEHKEKQARKMWRRAKWENWKKTQAMFYCKTSTNYRKWDMFESDSEEKEEDAPIVPDHDP